MPECHFRIHTPLPTPVQQLTCAAQAMFLMAWRLTKLYEEGRMSHEQVCLC